MRKVQLYYPAGISVRVSNFWMKRTIAIAMPFKIRFRIEERGKCSFFFILWLISYASSLSFLHIEYLRPFFPLALSLSLHLLILSSNSLFSISFLLLLHLILRCWPNGKIQFECSHFWMEKLSWMRERIKTYRIVNFENTETVWFTTMKSFCQWMKRVPWNYIAEKFDKNDQKKKRSFLQYLLNNFSIIIQFQTLYNLM